MSKACMNLAWRVAHLPFKEVTTRPFLYPWDKKTSLLFLASNLFFRRKNGKNSHLLGPIFFTFSLTLTYSRWYPSNSKKFVSNPFRINPFFQGSMTFSSSTKSRPTISRRTFKICTGKIRISGKHALSHQTCYCMQQPMWKVS